MSDDLALILDYSKTLFESYVGWIRNPDTSPKAYLVAAAAVTTVGLIAWGVNKHYEKSSERDRIIAESPSTTNLDSPASFENKFKYRFQNMQVIKIAVPLMSTENFGKLENHCKATALKCLRSSNVEITSANSKEITITRELHLDESIKKMDESIRIYLHDLIKSEHPDNFDENIRDDENGIDHLHDEIQCAVSSDLEGALTLQDDIKVEGRSKATSKIISEPSSSQNIRSLGENRDKVKKIPKAFSS